jgi:2-methylcitrate dehydratase PrpD
MHVDGNWPALGVAAGSARLLGEPASRIWQAINIAGCQLPTSLYAPIRTGDMARNTYLSHCASLGLLAAFSASGGITAPDDVLIQYASHHASPANTTAPAPDHHFLLEAYFKPHACVRHAHYGLEAAMRLRDTIAGDLDGIQSIALEVYEEAATYAGNRAPAAPLTGQFSLSLAVAAGLRFGVMGPEFYQAERFDDAQLRALERMVEISTRAELGEKGRRAAILKVVHRGQTLVEQVDSVAGGPERPLSRAFLVDKFVRYSMSTCRADRAEAFAIGLLDGSSSQEFAQLWNGLDEH